MSDCSYCLMQSSFFTTSSLNGVQSADPRYSLNKRQNMRNYFSVFFSNTQVKTLISQPLIHGGPEVASTEISRNSTKI
ncbi:hypothetical protein DQ181_11390 [Enterococcus faecium]|nr:hypothetical protein [Enterococcus faecium]ROX45765.1 hypothetical protein EGW26_06200 [Enterococcus faecium]